MGPPVAEPVNCTLLARFSVIGLQYKHDLKAEEIRVPTKIEPEA